MLDGKEGVAGSCKISRVPFLRRALPSSEDENCNKIL